MRFTIAAALTALCLSAPAFADPGEPQIDEPMAMPAGYQLVWADEFDTGALPDRSRWDYDTHRNREGWYNNELQYYAAERRENARIEDGALIIEARREQLTSAADYGGQNYTSTRLVTNGKASWTYGFFEIRAKLPCGRGTWPAIWTLAAEHQQGWPHDGEIDIMEHVGYDEGVVHGTVHTGAHNHMAGNHRTATIRVDNVCGAFHRYQMLWTPDRVTVGVDDRAYYQYSRSEGRAAWPFDSPQFLLLNIAIGGWGGAQGIDDSIFPVRMEVDYVRVYQAPR